MQRRCGFGFVAVFVFLLTAFDSTAQSTSATITGRIVDQSKAAIAGARVIATNASTGVERSVSTGSEGMYGIGALAPGDYRLEVQKIGFKTIIKPDLILHVQDVASVNFEMAVGTISESITVAGGTPLVDTESATVSTVVDRNFAENLPMNGRSFQTLIELIPGVVVVPSSPTDNGQFSINGQRPSSNYWMVDGVSANIGVAGAAGFAGGNGVGGAAGSFSASGGTNSLVSIDALQEFRIQTSTYAPEFGRTPGGQISIVTRSGTNQFHGAAFEYFRNDKLDANDWFANNVGQPRPQERQNDFGGTFSGPILKDRSFFFFSYEGLRLRLPQVGLTTVPCDRSCTDAGNVRAAAVPAMQPFLNAFPLPNGPEVLDARGTSTGAAEFNKSFSNKATLDAYSLRVDHRLNGKLSLFGRYNYSPSQVIQRGSPFSYSYALSDISPTQITVQTATMGAAWAVSPVTVNDFRFNYSRTSTSAYLSLDKFGGAVPLTSSPFPSPFTAQNSFFAASVSSLNNSIVSEGKGQKNLQRQLNIVDDILLQRASHAIKLGIDFRRLTPLSDPFEYLQEAFFSNISSFGAGIPDFGGAIASARSASLILHDLGVFAQDTWHLSPHMTLTYGLRWDVEFTPSTNAGPNLLGVARYDLNQLSDLAIAPAGTPIFRTKYGNIAPRIGAAYQFRDSQKWQTVLRGGFGMFYDLATSELGNLLGQGYPFSARTNFSSNTFPLDSVTAAPPPLTLASLSTSTVAAFNPDLNLPYTLEWNAAVEQALGREQSISASYLGSAGRRLLQSTFAFAPNPNFGSALLVGNAATSSYNALQIQFQRRLSHGLQALTSYTWSHSIDDASAGSSGSASNLATPGASPSLDRGPSSFDIRNGFSAALTYDIPARDSKTFTNAVFRGWSIQNIVQARSAPPVDVSDSSLFFQFSAANVRPDLVPGKPLYLYSSRYPGGKAFNPTAFRDPPIDPITSFPLRQGNVPRNFLRAFGAIQWDFALHREFPIHDSLKLQLRAEVFNALNHANLGPPNGVFGSGGFGLSNQTLGHYFAGGTVGGGALDALYQIGGPRSIQLALKLIF
jgi:carboxypeptidase family protein